MLEGVSDSAELIKRQPQLGQLMALSEGGHAERSKPSPRIFGKRHGTPEACGCGDNRGAVCLDGAASFVNCSETYCQNRKGLSHRDSLERLR